ncbi:hypothetical protein HGRIS_006611 [Hohenbuehelia grisea]|uniref:NACHT domain-containing protein n=1 Tax=Hohenbuehelia grisea TaxID=104357 RepID=A0ABR3JAL0_9AGAR
MSSKRPLPFDDSDDEQRSRRKLHPMSTGRDVGNNTNAGFSSHHGFVPSLEQNPQGESQGYTPSSAWPEYSGRHAAATDTGISDYYDQVSNITMPRPNSYGGYTTDSGAGINYEDFNAPRAWDRNNENNLAQRVVGFIDQGGQGPFVPREASPISSVFPSSAYNPPSLNSFGQAEALTQRLHAHADITIGPGAIFNQPTMTNVEGNQTINNMYGPVSHQADSLETKLRHVPMAGIHSQSEDGCMDGTRVALLEALQLWSCDSYAPRVYWLVGAAGAGKSAIARSLARWLSAQGLLGGSFFCHRPTASRADARAIVRTLACFLSRQSATYRHALIGALKSPRLADVAEWTVDLQIEELFVKLLKPLRGDFVFVVDALDECSRSDETNALLTKLLSISSSLPAKWFIASRPERHIRDEFEYALDPTHRQILHLHEIEKDVVMQDITIYIRYHLYHIRDRRPVLLNTQWPKEADIVQLATLAGNLFIYAATAVKYISEGDPVERLRKLTCSPVDAGRPMTGSIDEMYKLILAGALDLSKREPDEVSLTKRAISTILTVVEPLPLSTIAALLNKPVGSVRACLDRVHAVIHVPSDDQDMVTMFHASFADFLTTDGRAPRNMAMTLQDAHDSLVARMMSIMMSDLKFNISGCTSSYVPHNNQATSQVPPALVYSCLNWAHHTLKSALTQVQDHLKIMEEILETKFLFWVEVLGVTGNGGSASSILQSVRMSGLPMTDSLRELLFEANDFVIAFRDVMKQCVPHIYLSGIASWQKESRICRYVEREYAGRPHLQLENLVRRKNSVLCLEGHSGSVMSAAFSPDGTRIVSGSYDQTIRVWDASTGHTTMPPLEGHSDTVISAAFSPDGTRIVSGSSDSTIRVWDASTGHPTMPPLEGHSDKVTSVAFSPDGTRIVSGSSDRTIRVWDASTGHTTMPPLEGHSDTVISAAISPDGTRIVSGSSDRTIRVWDASTGHPTMPPLEGHSGSVISAAFSPDGTRIVSGSSDRTIRVWDASTGHPTMPPLEGHSGSVISAAFSPDGTRIVSGSSDRTIRVWDASTGHTTMPPLEGHSESVASVAFSPDGIRVVSGSYDHTTRVWDASSGNHKVISSNSKYLIVPLEIGSSHLASPTDESDLQPYHSHHSSSPGTKNGLLNIPPDEDGWCRGPHGELLFWVLPEFRSYFFAPPCIAIMPNQRATIDMSHAAHGTRWTECNKPQN